MTKHAEHIDLYVKYLGGVALLCALYEFTLAAVRHPRWFTGVILSPVEKGVLVAYVLLILLFLVVALGLWQRAHWGHTTMLVTSAVGTLTLLTLFIAGIYLGGLLEGTYELLLESLEPLDATRMALEMLLMIAPFVLFFNPLNLWLFAKDTNVHALFLPPQKAAPALKRKEL